MYFEYDENEGAYLPVGFNHCDQHNPELINTADTAAALRGLDNVGLERETFCRLAVWNFKLGQNKAMVAEHPEVLITSCPSQHPEISPFDKPFDLNAMEQRLAQSYSHHAKSNSESK